MNQNQGDPDLAKALATALEEQVQQVTGKLAAQVAELRASSNREIEASERKRRKPEDLTACKNRLAYTHHGSRRLCSVLIAVSLACARCLLLYLFSV